MSTKVILTNADFSENAIPADTRWRLKSTEVVNGLINPDGTIREPDSGGLYAKRITINDYILLGEYDSITLPTGYQFTVAWLKQDGTMAVTSSNGWIKNETGSTQTMKFTKDPRYSSATATPYKVKISIGRIDTTDAIAPSELDQDLQIYLIPNNLPEEKTFTSDDAEEGFLDNATGAVTQDFPKRCSLPQVYRLAEYDQIYIPEGLKWFIVYSNGGQYYENVSTGVWTETTGWQDITTSASQLYSNCPNATEFQICLGRIDNEKLYASSIGTTYTVKIRNKLKS